MKKTISIATLAVMTSAAAVGAITATKAEFRPRKDVIEPTIMTVAAETNAVNPDMFAAEGTTAGTVNQGTAASNQSADFLGATRNNYTTRHSASEINRQAHRQADYNTVKRNTRKNNSYNPERNAGTQDGSGNAAGYTGVNQGYTDSRYQHNRMSDYGNYMHNQLHGAYGNPFEGRTDCRTYKLRGDVYIVIPELSALDMLGHEYHGSGMHHNRGRHTGVPDSRTQAYDRAASNNNNPTTSGTSTDGTSTAQHTTQTAQ